MAVNNTLYLPELREMLANEDGQQLQEFCMALHPARVAEFMEGLDVDETYQVLRHAPPGLDVEIFTFFEPEKQIAILETQDRSQIAHLIGALPPDDRVDLLKQMDPKAVQELLPLVHPEERRDILRLISHAEGTAGAVMTTEFAKVEEHWSVKQALDEIARQSEHLETIYYLYVVDHDDHLLGLVSFRRLISALGRPAAKVSDLMERGLVVVHVDDSQLRVAEEVARYDLLAIPVVDHQRHILGIITHDDVIDMVREEASRDAQRLGGMDPLDLPYLQTAFHTLAWKRGVWLTALFFSSLLTAIALKGFEKTLSGIEWLVMFIPLVISSGGNSGSQTATLVITSLKQKEIDWQDLGGVLRRELLTGLMLGACLGALGYVFALCAHQTHDPVQSLVLPLTLLAVVTSGTVLGTVLPLAFHRLGLDPTLMSNPCVAAISDILGIVIYCSVAMQFLK